MSLRSRVWRAFEVTVLRCTAKLLKAMKAAPDPMPVPADNRLGEWAANLVRVSRTQWVVAVNEKTRLCVVIDAAPYARVPERLIAGVADSLRLLQVPDAMIEAEMAAMWPMRIAAGASRSVLGTLNQMAVHLDADLQYGLASSDIGLSRRMLRMVVLQPKHIGFPADRVRECFGLPLLDRSWFWPEREAVLH